MIEGSTEEVFLSNMIIPVTKMVETILLSLPGELFERRIRSIKTLFNTECTYISLNMYWGTSTDDQLPSIFFVRKGNDYISHLLGENHEGFHLHQDNNKWSFGAVLIFGADINGFDQRYVTLALQLPCPGWSLVLGDYCNLLHAVTQGKNNNGLRFSLVIANHQSTVKGINEHGQQVYNVDNENEFDQNYVCEKRQCGVCKLPLSMFDKEHDCHHCDQYICYMCNKYSQCIKEFDKFIVPKETMREYRTQMICANCLPEVWSKNKMILNTVDRMREQ